MKKGLLLSLATFSAVNAYAQTPSIDELYEIIQKQQTEIEALQSTSKEQDKRIELTADAIESSPASASKTSIGGYAELHYNNLNNKSDAGGHENEIDLHRFVLFLGHEFSPKTRFFGELEVEHALAGEGKAGEVEVEQAYIEHDITDTQHFKAGVFLVPVGFLNETHEPDTFYGVERNNVEKNIIPTTWWEGGFGFHGELGAGFSYDTSIHSGLYIDPTSSTAIRSGRQKTSEAKANDLAATLRLKYTGVKGLEVGLTTQYQNDIAQGEYIDAGTGEQESLSATLVEAHVAYTVSGFTIKALAAQWNIDSEINKATTGSAIQNGFYLEPSYRINEQFGVFARYSEWDNRADDKDDLFETKMAQVDIGMNYWIHPQVVLKLDIQDQSPEDKSGASKELDGFNLGVGLSF